MTLDGFNRASDEAARAALVSCCTSPRWVAAMLSERPYSSAAQAMEAADLHWRALSPDEWIATFAAHPRLAEGVTLPGGESRAAAWSAAEQATVGGAPSAAKESLKELGQRYEARFGYRYIVFASGRTADELLADCRARLANDPEIELRRAAAEHHRITRRRLTTLLEDAEP